MLQTEINVLYCNYLDKEVNVSCTYAIAKNKMTSTGGILAKVCTRQNCLESNNCGTSDCDQVNPEGKKYLQDASNILLD